MQPRGCIWSLMKGNISRRDDIATTDDLRQALEEEWAQLGPEEVQPFVESMAGRMTELLRCRWWPHSLLVGLLLLVREVQSSTRTTSSLLFFIVFFPNHHKGEDVQSITASMLACFRVFTIDHVSTVTFTLSLATRRLHMLHGRSSPAPTRLNNSATLPVRVSSQIMQYQ